MQCGLKCVGLERHDSVRDYCIGLHFYGTILKELHRSKPVEWYNSALDFIVSYALLFRSLVG